MLDVTNKVLKKGVLVYDTFVHNNLFQVFQK